MAIFLLSLFVRWRNLNKDLDTLESLNKKTGSRPELQERKK
jgi:hypothetical protein